MQDQFSQVATLIGDPVRAKILWALMDKRAYTATELAVYADTTAQNISMHLNKLVKADLLTVESQGRHKYYNYSRPEIAYAIEALASLLPKEESKMINTADEKPIRFCRSCYDHLAGKVGVTLTESLLKHEYLVKNDNSFSVTGSGEVWFDQLGIKLDELKKQKRHFAKPCLDWSERKHHLAGALGAALLSTMIADGWIRRIAGSRAITVTGKGEAAFLEHFKTDIR
ncbi:MAG TPA: winged helix-turn-helix domain-containing protein [Mucilaginibacter sp.]|jgi:DNA-binding transcriptional ArsR family regulator|nr:winged helix-turn-helix domain-containing protein [Mucilaginibacter sp.]